VISLAADAYVYGFPLVFDVDQMLRLRYDGIGALRPAPFNEFSHASRLAGPEDRFVSVNNDTLYSAAQLDLSGGPLLLRVPDTGGAYYVLQFIDAWTNNIAYVGRRATGTGAATYLVVPPDWRGNAPDGARVVQSPTTIATIVGRFACDGPDDVPRVRALQEALTLTPLTRDAPLAGVPEPDGLVPEELVFFEKLRVWMAAFRPATVDLIYQERFTSLGLLETNGSPYRLPPPELAEALVKGMIEGRQRIEDLTRQGTGSLVNGWGMGLHLFDYNTDHLGPGTIDAPQWKITDRAVAYATRALAARAGLWGNHAYEAVYAYTFVDSDGEPLVGSRSYALAFPEPPPVEAFWSLTMYDLPDFFLVANPIDRYSVGDRTPGLRYGEDGSLTILLQHDRPSDPDSVANWLPAPAGEFRPIIRLYQPQAAVLDGRYQLPPVQRLR